MPRILRHIILSVVIGWGVCLTAYSAVSEKKFGKYQQTILSTLTEDIDSPKKIEKSVNDIIERGSLEQLYWLAEQWIGLDLEATGYQAEQMYLDYASRLICRIMVTDTLFIPLQDGRDVKASYERCFYPRDNNYPRARLKQAIEMLTTLYSIRQTYTAVQNTINLDQNYAFVRKAIDEENHIKIHYVERMIYGDDRYSAAHISPRPENSMGVIRALLGEEVVADPTLFNEYLAALPEEKDSLLIAQVEDVLIFSSYYLSNSDQNYVYRCIGLAANRLGSDEEGLKERLFAVIKMLYPIQYTYREEDMESLKSSQLGHSQILSEFSQLQDSLREEGFGFMGMPLYEIPLEIQNNEEWMRYLEQYLRVGYAFCKEVVQLGNYTYIMQHAEDVRVLLRTMGYYSASFPQDVQLLNRLVYYLCELIESTQSWYYGTHDAWTIGAIMVEHQVLTALLTQHFHERIYETMVNSASFFYSVLNNEEFTKSILESYLFPVLPGLNLLSRDKEENCYFLWYYASILRYTYRLYKGEEAEQLGQFYSDRLLKAVRYNKDCGDNGTALLELAQYYYFHDEWERAAELADEYLAFTDDSLTYHGLQYVLNYHHRHDYTAAAKDADFTNRDNKEEMASWYNEYSLTPSRVYALAGREEEALEQLDIFNIFMRKEIGKQLMGMGTEQASQMMKRYSDINDVFVKLCKDTLDVEMKNAYMQAFYNWQLQSKGLLLALNTETDSLLANHPSSYIRELYQRCKQREKALAEVKDVNSPESLTMQYNLLQAKNNLQTAVQEYIDKHGFEGVNQAEWTDVQSALQEGQVAIEIVNGKMEDDSIATYYALLLRHDSPAPVPIRLFSEREVTSLLMTGNQEQVNKTYSYIGNGHELAQKIWGAILPYIHQGEVVFFSPSGVLHQIAIESLPVDRAHIMSDVYNLVRLSSTREIINGKKRVAHHLATLYGGIHYGATPVDLAVEHQKYKSQYDQSELALASNISRMTLRDMAIDLPGTKVEVDSIRNLLSSRQVKVQTYQAKHATEESFKALTGKKQDIIHLATHGFYWSEEEAHQQQYFAQKNSIESDVQQALPIDPLDRCGLLFAGANTALGGNSKRLDKGVQDGILTAKEIANLDLRGADIVVLSACETGLGDISGEGVFGLQRAFKIAGVQTMLMALWKVHDDATQMLMTSFYRHMSEGETKREAFHHAQQEVRNYSPQKEVENTERGVLQENYKNRIHPASNAGERPSTPVAEQPATEEHPYASPYFWAGFVLLD